MPFRDHNGGWERANALGHVPTVNYPMVKDTLSRYLMPDVRARDTAAINDRIIDPVTLDQQDVRVRHTIATDGSPFEHEVDPAFPSTRILFMQLAAVIVDLDKLATRSGSFVDPGAIRDATKASVLAGVLPSSNLMNTAGVPPKQAFREEVDRLFRQSEVDGRTLLEVLLEVEAESNAGLPHGAVRVSVCPIEDCKQEDIAVPAAGTNCPACGEHLFAVDALRVHEAFHEHGSNLEACGRVMSVAERFISLAVLGRVAERRPSALASMAFITDGPLALFGEVAPLKRPLLRRMQTLAQMLISDGFGLPVIVGVEKSGMFAEHARQIREYIPAGHLMLLDQDYIERYITFSGSPHGRDTYYGRHFFYHAVSGQMHVITVPPLGRAGAESRGAFVLDDYPTLKATCKVFDRIGTRLYQDATIPVALAHQYAAYPLATASKVLKLHAEEHLDRSPRATA